MPLKPLLLTLGLLTSVVHYGQSAYTLDTAEVNSLINQARGMAGADSAKAIALGQEALKKAKAAGYSKGAFNALKALGMVYYGRGYYLETLDYWNQSLEVAEASGDEDAMANMLNNISAVYLNQGADAKALEYSLRSLTVAEKMNDTLRMISALINVGSTYYNKRDTVALKYLLKVIPMAEQSGSKYEYIVATGNTGEIYFDQKQDEKAIYYFQKSIEAAGDEFPSAFALKGIGNVYLREGSFEDAMKYQVLALENARKFGDNLLTAGCLRGVANVYMKMGNVNEALNYLNQARQLAENMDDANIELKFLYQELANAYAKARDFEKAFTYKSLYSNLKDTLYNIESKKQLNQLQYDFELSKKEAELTLQSEKLKSEKQKRMGITITVGILLLGSILLYRSYLQTRRINRILDRQKDEIENLLLNILPREIAVELQTIGTSKPRHIDEVAVLFTDFEDFTKIADKMDPNELIHDLNECFVAFDEIVEKYGLEKIKTIGDSYMCASNLPSGTPDHSYKIIKAAIDIQKFLEQWNMNRAKQGKATWQIRIGVHTGPVVAGVVGKKKYAYDIWGNTVNIASRMESACEPGKVNISANAYEKVKDRFEFSHRGKISAKNIEDMDMYYVEGERTLN